jgi:hypothetical protein
LIERESMDHDVREAADDEAEGQDDQGDQEIRGQTEAGHAFEWRA